MNLIDQHADTLKRLAKKTNSAQLTKDERDLMIILATIEMTHIGNAARFAELHPAIAARIVEKLNIEYGGL